MNVNKIGKNKEESQSSERQMSTQPIKTDTWSSKPKLLLLQNVIGIYLAEI